MKKTTKKKYYRIVDMEGEPYYTGYNETDLKELAYSMFCLGYGEGMRDDETYYGPTDETAIEKIYSLLKAGYRNLAYYVQESDTPFEELEDFNY